MRILVIEDEPDLLAGLVQALREESYAVDEASDGEDGLFKATSWSYDAIILDWMLPKMSGIELLERLRREKNDAPVLMMTARDAINDRVHGLDCGADDYLVKPIQLAELNARLRALIRRSSGASSARIEWGRWSVDTVQHLVMMDGKEVSLTAREYRLVEMFALHRQEIVTRTMIYESLFDENHDSMSNLVDVYVSRLRSKLGKEFVTTRRGLGYIVDV